MVAPNVMQTRQSQVLLNNKTSSNSRIQQSQSQMIQNKLNRHQSKTPDFLVKEAQEFNPNDYFSTSNDYLMATEFAKEGYNVEFYPDGKTVKRIWSNPKEYTSYYKKKGKDKDFQKSKYIPHEITFNKDGQIISEIKRDDYESYDKRTDDYTKRKRKVYESFKTEYNPDGSLKTKKIYDDYSERDSRTDDYRKQTKDVFLKEDYDYTKGTKQSYSRPRERESNTTTEYLAKQEAKAQAKYDGAMAKYNNASSQSEKNRIANQYGLKWSVTTPDGKTYNSSNQEWLQSKYSDYFENETTSQRNKRYIDMMNSGEDLSKVKETILKENPDLYVQEYSQTPQGRQKLVNEGIISGIEDSYNQQSRMLSPQEIKEYVQTGKIRVDKNANQTNTFRDNFLNAQYSSIPTSSRYNNVSDSNINYTNSTQYNPRKELIEKYYGNLPEAIVENMRINADKSRTDQEKLGDIFSGRSSGDTVMDAFTYASNNNFKPIKEGNMVYNFPFTFASLPDELYDENLSGKENMDKIYADIQHFYGISPTQNPISDVTKSQKGAVELGASFLVPASKIKWVNNLLQAGKWGLRADASHNIIGSGLNPEGIQNIGQEMSEQTKWYNPMSYGAYPVGKAIQGTGIGLDYAQQGFDWVSDKTNPQNINNKFVQTGAWIPYALSSMGSQAIEEPVTFASGQYAFGKAVQGVTGAIGTVAPKFNIGSKGSHVLGRIAGDTADIGSDLIEILPNTPKESWIPTTTGIILANYVADAPFGSTRIQGNLVRNQQYKTTLNRLESEFGAKSPEVEVFKTAWQRAYKELPRNLPVKKDIDISTVESAQVMKKPHIDEVTNIMNKYNPTIVGSLIPPMQTNLKQPVRGYAGDVDIQTSTDSKAMTKEIYDYMKSKGYNVKLHKNYFHGSDKYHITLDGKEFINAGTSYSYFRDTQINPLLGLLERKGYTSTSPDGNIKLSPTRDQLRVKIQKGYVEGFRPKDVIDVAGIVKATNSPSYHKKTVLEKLQNTFGTEKSVAKNKQLKKEIELKNNQDVQNLKQKELKQFNQQAQKTYQDYYANRKIDSVYNNQYPEYNQTNNQGYTDPNYPIPPVTPVYDNPNYNYPVTPNYANPVYDTPTYQTPYGTPYSFTTPITQLETNIELPSTKQSETKDNKKGKRESKKVKGYRPVLVTESGVVVKGKPFSTEFGAESETMFALDELPYNQGYVEEVIADIEEIKKARSYRQSKKFIKKNGIITERRYARFDKPKERKQGNFNIMPYVFGGA
jgi:hypothetical protein